MQFSVFSFQVFQLAARCPLKIEPVHNTHVSINCVEWQNQHTSNARHGRRCCCIGLHANLHFTSLVTAPPTNPACLVVVRWRLRAAASFRVYVRTQRAQSLCSERLCMITHPSCEWLCAVLQCTRSVYANGIDLFVARAWFWSCHTFLMRSPRVTTVVVHVW